MQVGNGMWSTILAGHAYAPMQDRILWGYRGSNGNGNGLIAQYDVASSALSVHVLDPSNNADNHCAPSLLVLPSGRLLASWMPLHADRPINICRSVNPGDASAWDTTTSLLPDGYGNYAYPRTHLIDSVIWLIYRNQGGSGCLWNFIQSADEGITWSAPVGLVDAGHSGLYTSSYIMSASFGSRLDLLISSHARDSLWLYHIYFDGQWRRSDGTAIGHNPPFTGLELTKIYDGQISGGNPWIVNICHTPAGLPRGLWVKLIGQTHELYSCDLENGQWINRLVCTQSTTGGVNGEYEGGGTVDIHDAMSCFAPQQVNGIYEMARFQRSGETWAKAEDLTSNSGGHQWWPTSMPIGITTGKRLRVGWQSTVTFTSYNDYDVRVMAWPDSDGNPPPPPPPPPPGTCEECEQALAAVQADLVAANNRLAQIHTLSAP